MAKILIVDDSYEMLELFSTVLTTAGYKVQTTQTIVNCKDLLPIFLPDLILMDVMLGFDDGRELCQELKELRSRNIPIILISANVDLLKGYEKCKADAAIEKPFDIKNLLALVKKILMKFQAAGN